jgi:hypothetical protein
MELKIYPESESESIPTRTESKAMAITFNISID